MSSFWFETVELSATGGGEPSHKTRRASARRTRSPGDWAQARHTPARRPRPAHQLGLHLRRDLPERGQGRRPRHALLRHRGDDRAPRRELRTTSPPAPTPSLLLDQAGWRMSRAWSSRTTSPSSRSRRIARTEPGRERLAVHARQLALEPRLPILRRHRRSLLRRVEPPRRPAMEHHLHRPTRLGPWVPISGSRYWSS